VNKGKEKAEAARDPGPCILFVAVKYGRVGATDRLRPWSTKVEKTARKSKGRRAFLFEKRARTVAWAPS
jgi:hypothetical protein